MLEAVIGCKERGVKKVVCESDSAQLIKAINAGESPPELYGILSDVYDISCYFDVIFFSWISRENNKATDSVAKLCLVEEEVIMART